MKFERLLGCLMGSFVKEADRKSEEAHKTFERKLDNGVGESIAEIGRLMRENADERSH